MNKQLLILYCAIAFVLPTIGCSDSKKQNAIVQGMVTMDGELAKHGIIKFHPESDGPIAYGTIHEDGSFAMRIGQGKEQDLDESVIYTGKYIATVVVSRPAGLSSDETAGPREPRPRLSASKYSRKETSNLHYDIKPGRNVLDIAIESSTPEELQQETENFSESEEVTTETQASENTETKGTESSVIVEESQE